MSVPDQYAFRTGVFKPVGAIHGIGLTLGARLDGIPVKDILGDSDGFRRPGFVVSIDPGISYMLGNFTTRVNVPLTLVRNRTRSLTDIADSTPENSRHGDAAFADYLINVSLAWRILKKEKGVFNSLN